METQRPILLLTLPVYNESVILEQSVRTVHAWLSEHASDFAWQIQIADNGSTDNTFRLAEQLKKSLSRVSVFHTDEKGRGQVLRRAWQSAEADFYTYMDIDLAVDLKDYKNLIQILKKKEADVVIGSRLMAGARVERSPLRELTSRVYNWLVGLFVGLRVRDTQCGFKGITKEAARAVLSETRDSQWFWDTEMLALAASKGYRIQEVPVDWVETRTKGRKSKVAIVSTILNYVWNLFVLRLRLRNPKQNKGRLGTLIIAALIFIFSFIISLIFADHQTDDRYYDQGNYILAANLIADGQTPHSEFALGHFAFYPWLLSWVIRLGGSFETVRFVHFALIAGVAVLLFLLVSRQVKKGYTLALLALMGVSSFWFIHSGLVLLDFLALFFVCFALLVFTRYQSRLGIVFVGLLAGLAVTAKISVVMLLLALGLAILMACPRIVKESRTWLFAGFTLLPIAVYFLIFGPVDVWRDVLSLHLYEQTAMTWDMKGGVFISQLLYWFPFLPLGLVAAGVVWRDSDPRIRAVARAIPLFFIILFMQRSMYLHHVLLLTPFLLFVQGKALTRISRKYWLGLVAGLLILGGVFTGISQSTWFVRDTTDRESLVRFLKTIDEPVFASTPFWVLQAGGEVAKWKYMSASDVANKQGAGAKDWEAWIKEAPVLIDLRAEQQVPSSVLEQIKISSKPLFTNNQFMLLSR